MNVSANSGMYLLALLIAPGAVATEVLRQESGVRALNLADQKEVRNDKNQIETPVKTKETYASQRLTYG